MAEFEIESGRISGYAGQMEGYSGQLKAQKGRVTDVAWKLALQGGTQNVKKALAKIASDLEKQQVQVKQYGQILENIRKEYQNTEAAIVTAASPQKKVEEEKNEVLTSIADLLRNLSSEFGFVGSTLAAVLKLITNAMDGIDEKDIWGLVGAGNGMVGKIAGLIDDMKEEKSLAALLFGDMAKTMGEKLDFKPTDSLVTKWKKYFKDQKGDYGLGDKAKDLSTAGKVKVAAKYVGTAIDFALTAFDNKEEYGGEMTGRAWEETISETLVSAGEGLLIGGGVTLVMGAGAPVVAVGVVTAGVTWAVDMGYRWISGSETGLVEDVSDFLCDNVFEPVGNAVGNWAKDTWDSMTNFFSGRNKSYVPAGAGGGR